MRWAESLQSGWSAVVLQTTHPPIKRHFLCTFFPYLTAGSAAKSRQIWDDLQKGEEVLVVIAEALTEH